MALRPGGSRTGEGVEQGPVRMCRLERVFQTPECTPFARLAPGQSPEQLMTLESRQGGGGCSALFPVTKLWPFPGPVNRPELEDLTWIEPPDYHS